MSLVHAAVKRVAFLCAFALSIALPLYPAMASTQIVTDALGR